MIFFLILSAVTLAKPPAAATEAVAAATTADATDAPVICKRVPVTGSLQGRRECHTRAEWDQARKETARRHDPYGYRAGPAVAP